MGVRRKVHSAGFKAKVGLAASAVYAMPVPCDLRLSPPASKG